MNETSSKLLEVTNLKTIFPMQEGLVHAVDGATFDVFSGKTLGVVGESGCGKSVAAQSILRIVPAPGRIVEGEIVLYLPVGNGDDSSSVETISLTALDPAGAAIRAIRGKEISMIFQEPMSSLCPAYTIGNQIMEVIQLHQHVGPEEARARAIQMLDHVGMPQADRNVDEFPFRLSGGMRQRAMIAMALSCHPKLLIADEPTTALDVTTQAQILDLMRRLQAALGMAIMFITHDLGVIAEMADDVIIMYLGKVIESADVKSLFHDPRHPYTTALLRSIPDAGVKTRKRLESIMGTVPDPYRVPPGCSFHPRCTKAIRGLCETTAPEQIQIAPGHMVRCHLYH